MLVKACGLLGGNPYVQKRPETVEKLVQRRGSILSHTNSPHLTQSFRPTLKTVSVCGQALGSLAGAEGIEPPLADLDSAVFLLDDAPSVEVRGSRHRSVMAGSS
jgi:hypothetical protein